jgi:DNA-binding transcriptional regulator GbsR (MarR family)
VIGALADTLERQGFPIEAIDLELVKLGAMSQMQREESALAWLAQWCQQQQKRLLLLMDSTDLIFSNLASAAANKRGSALDGGANALWRVRKVLLHSPHFFWLGGSYQPLEADGLYSDAFLDFFQLIELRPLSLLEMQTAILALARTFGAGRGLLGEAAEQEVKRMLDQRPERLRAMRQLTGGNPRTTITLYELFAAGGQESVRSDLERLLDAMTPLYKAKLEILADQMRKVLAHVMESWAPVTAKHLADVSGIAVGVVSTQLLRLEQEGLVEKVSLSAKKRQGYQAAERLFNIWYLVRYAPRSARAQVRCLVAFMQLWYGKDELQGRAPLRVKEYSREITLLPHKVEQERDYGDWARPVIETPLDLQADEIDAHAILGHKFALLKRNDEATEQYRLALKMGDTLDDGLCLQAHCWLGNSDLALQSLDALARKVSQGESDSFFRLKEQCCKIYAIGLGTSLRELMERSNYCGFLQPFILALRAASGENEAMLDAPAEVRSLAEDILSQITS